MAANHDFGREPHAGVGLFEVVEFRTGFMVVPTRPVRLVLAALVFTLVALVAANAHAGEHLAITYYTGNDVHEWCAATPDSHQAWACAAYATAMAEALSLEGAICVPAGGTTNGQMRDIVAHYLRDHPGKRHQAAVWLARAALTEAWPCP